MGWGNPTKQIVDELIRKRGYMKGSDTKRIPISDNVVVEELLADKGIICIEDIIDAIWRCKSNEDGFNAVKQVLWPIQLAPLKETTDKAFIKHDATGRDIKRKTTRVHKGGYLGMMGQNVNAFVSQLI